MAKSRLRALTLEPRAKERRMWLSKLKLKDEVALRIREDQFRIYERERKRKRWRKRKTERKKKNNKTRKQKGSFLWVAGN